MSKEDAVIMSTKKRQMTSAKFGPVNNNKKERAARNAAPAFETRPVQLTQASGQGPGPYA